MKILLIEDNKSIALNIKRYLELSDYEVFTVENGLYGLEVARKNDFDLMILDLMLPGMDGEKVCEEIKKEKDIPVIMTTAKGQLEDKLEGFNVGADDYLVKPFDLEELEARIKALTRRKLKDFKPVKKGNVTIDIYSKKIKKGDKDIKLTLKEYNILEYLVKNIGLPVSRTDIIEEIRGGENMRECDGKLDVYISTIRSKLGKDVIETVKGFGYKISK